MIVLGGIELPNVLIDNEFARQGVRSVVKYSLGGAPIVWEQELQAKPMDLVGGGDFAWIKRSVLLQLYSIANVPGSIYSLDYNGTTYQVRFRNEEPPVITAQPIVGRVNSDGEDYYCNLIVKLLEL